MIGQEHVGPLAGPLVPRGALLGCPVDLRTIAPVASPQQYNTITISTTTNPPNRRHHHHPPRAETPPPSMLASMSTHTRTMSVPQGGLTRDQSSGGAPSRGSTGTPA